MYCARRKRGLGEADKEVPKFGVPENGVSSALSGASRRGLGMLNGFDGELIVVRSRPGRVPSHTYLGQIRRPCAYSTLPSSNSCI